MHAREETRKLLGPRAQKSDDKQADPFVKIDVTIEWRNKALSTAVEQAMRVDCSGGIRAAAILDASSRADAAVGTSATGFRHICQCFGRVWRMSTMRTFVLRTAQRALRIPIPLNKFRFETPCFCSHLNCLALPVMQRIDSVISGTEHTCLNVSRNSG